MINRLLLFLFLQTLLLRLFGQSTFPTNGAPFDPHSVYVFTNATLQLDYETQLKQAMLIIKDGRVVSAGEKTDVPKGAVVIDLKGKFIYPSFIDLYSDYGLPDTKFEKKPGHGPQIESTTKGAYGWNQAIRPQMEAYKLIVHNPAKADELKKCGFGCVLSSSKDGIVRGSGVLIHLNAAKKENESIVSDRVAAFYSFSKGSSTQEYPSSLTGAIALLRQTYYDAEWYAKNAGKTEFNISLDEFNKLQGLPAIFAAGDKYNDLRAAKIGKEFNVRYILKGGGNEYQRINELQNTSLKFILPLNFPEAYDVEDPYDAESITLTELKHWELAPANPAVFEKNAIPFSLTTSDLKEKDLFLKNLRKAVQYGLSEKAALKALTANPAQFINAYDKIGALKKGYYANFFISSASIFDEDAVIMEHWVVGEPSIYADINAPDLRGTYELSFNSKNYPVKFSGNALKPTAQITVDTAKKAMSYNFSNNLITFGFAYDSTHLVRASGSYQEDLKRFEGQAQLADGTWRSFRMTYIAPADSAKKQSTIKKANTDLGKVIYPFTAYGEALPDEQGFFRDSWNKFKSRYGAILIKNATVWTNNGDSVLKGYDVYVVEGKIVRIAPNIDAPKGAFAKIINAEGKHLTPGIIDEHSHIALTAGVNEGTQASSAEVRMGDVINPEDINIYRQLSGGVTTAQLLHGSANPIGGQSALIKLRWGSGAEDMKYEKADPFIKFALGENVKQSNWGDQYTVRFPQSRMGVEQVYVDFFTRAREYDQSWQAFLKLSPKEAEKAGMATPRRDLELEALAEILNKKRFITCHSYVQSEVNMLMHVGDSLGFKVNTFTHILEGYKVADKMKQHGANASTFADWWAYKNEVLDAIPYNVAILTRMGVNTAVNSDDAEMARRLNQEAGKTIKYGGLSETEALKLVTLNPAKMLHIDDKVGSIQVGKVADLVVWSDNPLSIYARVEQTIIDGQIYFDRQEDARLRDAARIERARIIARLLAEKQKGAKTVKPSARQQRLYHCNTLEGLDEELTGQR